MSQRLSDATTELSSNDDSSVDEKPKPRRKAESTAMKTKSAAPKIILHDAKWTDGSISLGSVSDKLSKIGKVCNLISFLPTISIDDPSNAASVFLLLYRKLLKGETRQQLLQLMLCRRH
jgi:hypothetical protein